MQNQNYMSEYIRQELIDLSIDFFMNQADPNYNYFDNKNEKEALLPTWENVRVLIQNTNILDPHEKMLYVNRMKLGVSLSLFHYIPFKPDMEFILDQTYISSRQYIKDLNNINSCFHRIFGINSSRSLGNLLDLSILFKIQFPSYTSEPVPQDKRSKLKFVSSKKIIPPYCGFHPDVKIMDIENIISSGDISITKHFLNLDIHQMLASLHQLAHVSERNIHYILPILFHPALRGIKMTTARSYYEKYFPEYIIHDAEDMYRYRFPLAIKENGIEFAYCNRLNQNSDVFLELMNQCLFKMMNINSKYGIAIDQTHVLFIIIKSSSSSKSFSIHHNGAVVQVKCKVACIPYSAGQYNLCSLIAGFAFNHFKEAGKESNFSIKDLKVISKLSASDFKREAEWRYKMMKDICIFKLKNFTKIGDWYFFEKTLFKVHQKYMTEALKLDLDFKFLPRNKIGKMELISSDRILKRFRVEVLDHKISNHRKGMFLKVFNAVSAPQQFKRTRSLQFFGTLSFVFNNFLRDIVLLRDKYPCGFSEEESSSDNRMNFDPCIFSCGFVDWEKKRIKGFYILTEFIETEYFRAKKGKLKRKRILNEVDFGIIHGDIHPNNLLLDKDKLTLVSPDFGLSNVYAIEKDKRANLQNNDFWKSTTNDS